MILADSYDLISTFSAYFEFSRTQRTLFAHSLVNVERKPSHNVLCVLLHPKVLVSHPLAYCESAHLHTMALMHCNKAKSFTNVLVIRSVHLNKAKSFVNLLKIRSALPNKAISSVNVRHIELMWHIQYVHSFFVTC